MAEHQVAAGCERVAQRRHDRPGVVGVSNELQDGDEQQPDRLAEVDPALRDRVGQDFFRFAQVGLDNGGVLVTRQDGLAVRDGHRVDFSAGHAGARVGLLGDLVHVALGGDSRADVEELADACRGEEPHRPAEERPVGAGGIPDVGVDRGD
jgi:hypothetical protein